MKKITLFLLFACCAGFTANAQSTKELSRQRYSQPYKNILYWGGSIFMFGEETLGLIPFEVEYYRSVGGGFYFGVGVNHTFTVNWEKRDCYDYDCSSPQPETKTVTQLAGKVIYQQNLVRNRLYLHMGVGFGSGYHTFRKSDGIYRDLKRWLPYFTGELQCVFRINPRTDLKLSPILVTPSRVWLSSQKISSDRSKSFQFDFMHLSFGRRF